MRGERNGNVSESIAHPLRHLFDDWSGLFKLLCIKGCLEASFYNF